jgi:hypothetical protein
VNPLVIQALRAFWLGQWMLSGSTVNSHQKRKSLMGVDLNRSSIFGGLTDPAPASADAGRADLPKAEFWLNVGYEVGEPGTDDYRFVSLPIGIPVDTMKPIEIKTRNVEFGQFQSAQNDLLRQIQTKAAELAPGEAEVFGEGPLKIQLRRVNDPVTAPAADDSNPYSQKLFG